MSSTNTSMVVTVTIKFKEGMTDNKILRWIGFRLLKLATFILSTKIIIEAVEP